MPASVGPDRDVVPIGLAPLHLVDVETEDPAACRDEDPLQESRGGGFGDGPVDTDALEGLLEPRAAEGLQEEVDRLELEGVDGMLCVGGREDHRRSMLGALEDLEAGAARQPNVEEHQVGTERVDRLHRPRTVAGLADARRVRGSLDQLAEAGEVVVVDDEDAQSHDELPFGSRSAGPLGTATEARKRPS